MLPDLLFPDQNGPVDVLNPVNPHHPLNQGRVGWWVVLPQTDGGRQWFDLIAGRHFALTSGSSWVSAARPGGLARAISATDPSLSITWGLVGSNLSRTIAFWVRPTSATANRGFASVGATAASGNPHWLMLTKNTGLFEVYHGGNYREGLSLFTQNVWARMVYTYNAADNDTGLYINGVREYTGTVADSTTAENTNLYAGSGFPSAFGGWLDDFAVWNRALSPAQVRADYDLSQQGYPGVLNRQPFFFDMGSAAAPAVARMKSRKTNESREPRPWLVW